MIHSKNQVSQIREVFTYAERFSGKTFVFQIANAVMDDPLFPTLVQDLVTLQRAGIQIILVPGAHAKIEEILALYGIECRFSRGIRISPAAAMPFIKMAAFDVSNRVMTLLSGFDVNAVIGNWVRARSRGVVDGVDFEETGVVDRIKPEDIAGVLHQGLIPIFPCIGWNSHGRPYNLSSRELASVLARELKADKLFFVSNFAALRVDEYVIPDGAVSNEDGVLSRMSLRVTDEFMALNRESEGKEFFDLMRVALDACRGGVKRVHLVDGKEEGSILKEVFSSFGSGIMVYGNAFDAIRAMREDDIPAVLRIMNPLIEQKILVPRDERQLAELYPEYVVYETDGVVYGCGALHPKGPDQAEIAGIAVDSRHARLGIGQRIVAYLANRAYEMGLRRIFVLTTQASDWFDRMGFVQGHFDELPEEKKSSVKKDRNSRVLFMVPEKLEDK